MSVVVAVLLGETSKLRLFNFRVEKRSLILCKVMLGLFAGYILFRSKAKNLRSLVGDAVSPHYFMSLI